MPEIFIVESITAEGGWVKLYLFIYILIIVIY